MLEETLMLKDYLTEYSIEGTDTKIRVSYGRQMARIYTMKWPIARCFYDLYITEEDFFYKLPAGPVNLIRYNADGLPAQSLPFSLENIERIEYVKDEDDVLRISVADEGRQSRVYVRP